ncbi:glycosyltransferase (GT2) [Formosa agariphila KMM 3901]|uniref:Glycosyltransferase (GT2) n=1 Tax=Formosa agariphila (strain DSM 15362 / KCTC 12365 / LMG 23005 / KMM 3901 / M-2Alg 35-1) TaxID=1347342 RepID=T2KP36_FORAG|nr:glycosyltransferase family 2 protein [Formosa agariphila]CDF80228.1 glycosyltransferase (GT2) [Formosa agariphila KMM 3901]
MLSVLIPVYNYDVVDLVQNLHNQLMASQTPFEIICLDDASQTECISVNSNIESLAYTTFLKSSENNGRTKTRQLLCEASTFEWLLFIDADTLPVTETFISNYLEFISSEHEAIFGGFSYPKTPPPQHKILRWKYGRTKEAVDASIRNKTPYKVVISANFLIKKSVFKSINGQIDCKGYGLDNYFGALLKSEKINVFHINNAVNHLGLENNEMYLNKMTSAIQMLIKLVDENKIQNHDNDLLTLFSFLKKTKLNVIFSKIYKAYNLQMKNNLVSSNPSINLLQFYRISYMCYANLNS